MMMNLYHAIALTCVMIVLLPLSRLPASIRWSVPLLCLALTQLVVAGVTLAGHWSATVGEPSITTVLLVLLVVVEWVQGKPKQLPTSVRRYLPIIGVMALAFYPMTMGASLLDPYRFGYQAHSMLVVVAIAAFCCWWRGDFLPALLVAAATAAFAFDLLSSTNYWDYLLDPILAVIAIRELIRWLWQRRRGMTSPGAVAPQLG